MIRLFLRRERLIHWNGASGLGGPWGRFLGCDKRVEQVVAALDFASGGAFFGAALLVERIFQAIVVQDTLFLRSFIHGTTEMALAVLAILVAGSVLVEEILLLQIIAV
jgi:hypothetical protein